MARLAKWHDAHAWNAKRLRFRSAVCGRRFREQLRRINCRCQRPLLVRPAKEEILRDHRRTYNCFILSRGIETVGYFKLLIEASECVNFRLSVHNSRKTNGRTKICWIVRGPLSMRAGHDLSTPYEAPLASTVPLTPSFLRLDP